jgi:hypothetical protein
MISVTPENPNTRPITPEEERRSEINNHPANATMSGMVDAIIAAREASMDCMATKFNPK